MTQIKFIPDPPDNFKKRLIKDFPEPGTEVEFKGGDMAYPMFKERIDFANQNLVIGQKYKVTKTEVYSSWCAIWLDEFGQEERDFFHFSLFNK